RRAVPGTRLVRSALLGNFQEGIHMRLAWRSFRATAIVLIIAGVPRLAGSAAMADEQPARFAGTWKLIVLALGEDEHAIINVNDKDGKPAASVVNSQKMMLGDA